jgi:hypothetical protein
MNSSRKNKETFLLTLYKDTRTVYRLRDISLLLDEANFTSLNTKLNYYVRTGKLLNPRMGIYAKPGFNLEELACLVYTPSYISLQYVLQRAGVIFQFDPGFTIVSYLNRRIEVSETIFQFRKIKGEILSNINGINRNLNHVNIASPERAFLDLMYLETSYYFDNITVLNRKQIFSLLTLYNSKALTSRVKTLLRND